MAADVDGPGRSSPTSSLPPVPPVPPPPPVPSSTSSVPRLDPSRRVGQRGSSPATSSISTASGRPGQTPLVPMRPARRARREEESKPRSPQRRRFLVAAAALGAGGVAVQGLRVMTGDDEAPAAERRQAPLPAAAASPAATADPAAALPIRFEVPRLGLNATVLRLDLAADEALPVPAAVDAIGWFAGGTVPGRAGGPPAIVVGRADRDPAGALARIRDLRRTDDLLVTRTDGTTLVFRTLRVLAFPDRAFPDRALYAPRAEAELRLVAASGTFGRSRKTFAGCYVVTAVLAGRR